MAKKSKKKQSWAARHALGILITTIAIVVIFIALLAFAFIPYSGDTAWVYVPKGSTTVAVRDSLKTNTGSSMGTRVYMLWQLMHGTPTRAHGAYEIKAGETALSIARRLQTGRQTPVKVRFNSTRTISQLSEKIASQLEFTPEEFEGAIADVLPEKGFNKATYPAAFIPDTYEFYWSAAPENVVKRLLDYRNNFWNEERQSKAKSLGLSKVDVSTVASIIEEETAKSDERPKVARLYLNRLNKGMKLQADPTVKFATGDFALRRIKGEHLKIASPYNTYQVTGLPPGPIRVASGKAIDDVLNAPHHNFLYMCAKEDFSGYHNFATDYATHQANARRYQAELNKRNIH